MNRVLRTAFDANRQGLFAFIAKRLQDTARAEDVLHDIFLKCNALPDDERIAYPKAYLYRIANNLIIDIQRRESRHVSLEEHALEEQTEVRDPQRALDYSQQLLIVTQALQDLPQKTQDVVHLQRVKQMDKREVAATLDISVNMVEKHLRRALQHCRDKLFKLSE